MNKLRPGSIARIDPREDGKLRMSNVTKFLASCSAHGLSPDDLFLRDDLIEATSDSLARVAKTVIALVKWAETPPAPTLSQVLRGKGTLKPINTPFVGPSVNPPSSPYRASSSSRAVMSSPNLAAHSPPRPPHSPTRNNTRRWTPPSVGLPRLRSISPDVASSSSDVGTVLESETDGPETPTRSSDRDEVPPILPSRSPIRSRPSERSFLASGAVELPSFRESVRVSIADSTTNQSIASSSLTDMSTYSSLLDAGIRNGRNSSAHGNKFGTIRTVTTEATSLPSEWPSLTRTEASAVASSIAACDDNFASNDGNNYSPSPSSGITLNQGRRPSETIPVDLSRVVEESEESCGGGDHNRAAHRSASPAFGRIERIKLKQGKWPDDFLDVLQEQNFVSSRPIAIKNPSLSRLVVSADASPTGHDELSVADLDAQTTSATPPSNLESLSPALTARRPTHRARHSVDSPVLAPAIRDHRLPREASPDAAASSSGIAPAGRVALRRNSTRSGIAGQRNGVYVPKRNGPEGAADEGDGDPFVAVPFPRAVSNEHVPSPSPLNAPSFSSPDSADRTPSSNERSTSTGTGSALSVGSRSAEPPPPRGRFQSEVDGAGSRRRPRPNSYDEFGARPRRSRFESMVNLGVAAGEQASASDLMARDATEGSVSRQTLVVREEGKPPTHFVSISRFSGGGEGGRRGP